MNFLRHNYADLHNLRRRVAICTTGLATVAMGLLLTAVPQAQAAAAPRWELHLYGAPTNFPPGGTGTFAADLINLGSAPARSTVAEPIVLRDTLPAGVSLESIEFPPQGLGGDNIASTACSTAASEVTCTWPTTKPGIAPGEALTLNLRVSVAASEGTTLTDSIAVSGGGAPTTTASTSDLVSSTPAPFGFHQVEFSATDAEGHPYAQAGGHPFALTTTFFFNTVLAHVEETGSSVDTEDIRTPKESKDIYVDLPPGMIGNPQFDGNAGKCTLAQLWTGGEDGGSSNEIARCPANSQIGTITVLYDEGAGSGGPFFNNLYFTRPIYNMASAPGSAAQIGYTQNNNAPLVLSASLRSGRDYGVRISSLGLPEVTIRYVSVTTWGVPHDPIHNALRGETCEGDNTCGGGGGQSGDSNMTPYLRMPTSCASAPLPAAVFADSWPPEEPSFAREPTTIEATSGCAALHFQPKLEARPTTSLPDQPSGLDVDLKLKQENENPKGTATSDLKDAVIALPKGLKLNPSAGNGLAACSEAQIGYEAGTGHPFEFDSEPVHCPDASKIGKVEVITPVLEDPLPNPGEGVGALYLAKPFDNPFHSLLAAYLVIEDPHTGILVKLAGKVEADPVTGQLTTSFEESPQAPFEDLKVHIFGGASGSFRTPAVCGTYKSMGLFTPWSSSKPTEKSDEFAIAGNCASSEAAEPNGPSFDAGTESPQAGQFSPFAFKLVRQDGSQEISRIETVLPPGLTGKLAGVGECPESALAAAVAKSGREEQASPSCPASSEVGTVDIGAGAGPDPYFTQGHAYLAGPYKGAPLSLAIVTPAVAGPFDLGDVLVRTALQVNPETAQITAKSDEIPHILQGIPLDVRSVVLKMSRPNFTLNPTDCNPLAFTGNALSVLGASAPLTQRFQVGGCSALPFKPKLALSLKGKTTRAGHPALKAVLTMKPGEANVASAQVTLPRSEFLDNAHIKTVCTRVQFGEGTTPGERCPPGSVYGHARAITPLLDSPLEGPVYLRSSSHTLPDLVAALNGQIQVVLDGRVDSIHGGIRNSFEVVPDAPVSKFTLEMQGAKKGLLENSENLCSAKAKTHATVAFTAQNGKSSDTTPALANGCKGKGRKGKKHGKAKHPSHRVATGHR